MVKKSIEYIQKLVENNGYKLVSTYRTYITITCPNKHTYETTVNIFERGSRCPKCYHESQRRFKDEFSKDDMFGYLKIINKEDETFQIYKFDLKYFDIFENRYWSNDYGYACTYIDSDRVPMHRFIMNPPKDKVVDHIDRDITNNLESNLRICTNQENAFNKSLSKRNKSGVAGVFWSEKDNKWQAFIKKDNKLKYLGSFKLKEDAISARLEAEKKYFGEFSPNNVICYKGVDYY